MTRAAIYVRISRDPEGRRAGVERQERECRALAERRGWTVADVYEDNDVSAWSGKKRPAYERMLEDIADGRVGAVVAWHLDRLTRAPKELERFFEVCDAAGLKRMATVSGDIDLRSRDGQLNARILGAVAKKSSDDAAARIRSAFDQKASRGEYKWGGVRPFGYEWDEESRRLVPHPEEAALLREAAERILAGESRRRITQDWHARGVRTSEGKAWSITRLGELLASPRVAGLRVHRGEVVARGDWEPILDEETQRGVVRRMRRQPASHRPGRQRHVLTGLAVCGGCGSRLLAKARKNRRGAGFRTYRCSNDSAASCGRCSVVAEPLEQLVLWTAWEAIRPEASEVFERTTAAADEEDPDAQRLRDSLADVAETEKQLAHDHYVEGIVAREAFMEAAGNLREQRDGMERELAQLEGAARSAAWTPSLLRQINGPPATLAGADPETVEFWRGVVQEVFEGVEVKDNWHGRRFSADRVVLRPRPRFRKQASRPWPAWDVAAMSAQEAARTAGI